MQPPTRSKEQERKPTVIKEFTCPVCSRKLGSGDQVKMLTCDGCHNRRYCSVECQKSDWKTSHKQTCVEYRAAHPNKCVLMRMATALNRYLAPSSRDIYSKLLDGTNILLFQYIGNDAAITTRQMARLMDDALAYLEVSLVDVVILAPGCQLPKSVADTMQCTLLPRTSEHVQDAQLHPIQDKKLVFELGSWVGCKNQSQRQTAVLLT